MTGFRPFRVPVTVRHQTPAWLDTLAGTSRDPSVQHQGARVLKPCKRQDWPPERTQGVSGTASRRALLGPGLPARPQVPAPPSRSRSSSPHRPTALRPAHPGSDCRRARSTPGRWRRPAIGPPRQPMRWQTRGASPEARIPGRCF
ncbi:hypothetical protein HispidOSU_022474 [Sigmodon hispidus]